MTDIYLCPLIHGFDTSKDKLEAVVESAGKGRTTVLLEIYNREEDRLFLEDITNKSDDELYKYAERNVYSRFRHSFYNDLKLLKDLSERHGVVIKPIDKEDEHVGPAADVAFSEATWRLRILTNALGDEETSIESIVAAYAIYLILKNNESQFRTKAMLNEIKENINARPGSTFIVFSGFGHICEFRSALENDKRLHTIMLNDKGVIYDAAGLDGTAIAAVSAIMPGGSAEGFISEIKLAAGLPVLLLKLNKYNDAICAAFHEAQGQAAFPHLAKVVIKNAAATVLFNNRHLNNEKKLSEEVAVEFFLAALPEQKLSPQVVENTLLKLVPFMRAVENGKDIRSSTILEAFKDLFIAPALNENLRKGTQQKSKVC